jgi:hypothetical protein
MGGGIMFKRIRKLKEMVEIQIFSFLITAAVIVKEKSHRKRKYEDPSE